jgi:hypothetical protein
MTARHPAAAICGCPVGTIESWVTRAGREIRKLASTGVYEVPTVGEVGPAGMRRRG